MKFRLLGLLWLLAGSFARLVALDVSGVLTNDVTWRLADSPVHLTANVTLTTNATLTIEPGVEVRVHYRVIVTIEGNLIAEGTPALPIRFLRNQPAEEWRRLDLRPNARESRFVWCEINGASNTGNIRAAGTSLLLDHVVFTNTTSQLLTVDDTSIVVRHCTFPTITANELLHFNRMPPGGHALIEHSVFGTTTGYNDIIDFTGGNRPGPIARFLNNVFLSAVDDVIDLDGTDAHIEGNVFLNVRQDAARASSANAISSGADSGQISELTICRNLFYNVDHMLLLKNGGRAVVQNNTVVRVAENPLDSNPIAVINWGEPNRGDPPGGSCLFEGNLVWQVYADRFVANYLDQPFLVSHSLLPVAWPGDGNLAGLEPQLVGTNDITAENIRAQFALLPDSPARGAGPNGLDIGALVPSGPSISGEPAGSTTNTTAILRIAGPGIVAYRWRLDGGTWSDEVPLTNSLAYATNLFADARPVVLTNLPVGVHQAEVLGKNSAGDWSDEAAATRSRKWIVRAESLTLTLAGSAPASLRLTLPAVAGAAYQLQTSSRLDDEAWTSVNPPVIAANSGSLEMLLPSDPEGPARYFRVLEAAAP